MNKLAIERRVQYGAEKMLDVGRFIFSRISAENELI